MFGKTQRLGAAATMIAACVGIAVGPSAANAGSVPAADEEILAVAAPAPPVKPAKADRRQIRRAPAKPRHRRDRPRAAAAGYYYYGATWNWQSRIGPLKDPGTGIWWYADVWRLSDDWGTLGYEQFFYRAVGGQWEYFVRRNCPNSGFDCYSRSLFPKPWFVFG